MTDLPLIAFINSFSPLLSFLSEDNIDDTYMVLHLYVSKTTIWGVVEDKRLCQNYNPVKGIATFVTFDFVVLEKGHFK